MKEKILAAIKLKFPNVNLSQKRLDAIAAKVEAKVIDDETKIDATLDALNEIYPMADIAKDDHIRSTLEGKLKATQKKKEETPQDDPIQEPDADTPAWAKALIEQNKKLSEGLAAIQGEKVANTIKGKASELLKDIPVSYWGKRAIPDKEEGIEAFVAEVTADYTQFKQDLTNQGLSVLSAPKAAGGGAATTKTINPDIKAFVEKQAPAVKTA